MGGKLLIRVAFCTIARAERLTSPTTGSSPANQPISNYMETILAHSLLTICLLSIGCASVDVTPEATPSLTLVSYETPAEPSVEIVSEPRNRTTSWPQEEYSEGTTEGTTEGENTIEVYLGARTLSDDDWGATVGSAEYDLSSQRAFGIGGTESIGMDEVSWEWAILYSTSSDSNTIDVSDLGFPELGLVDVELSTDTIEFNVGARKNFPISDALFTPYAGLGLGLLRTSIEAAASADGESASVSFRDTAIGVYMHGGLSTMLDDSVSLGLDFRLLTGASYGSDLDGLDGDYSQFMLVLGFVH